MKKSRVIPGDYYPLGENAFPEKSRLRVRATGEFRPPKKGEWYLSGAIVEGYMANDDMTTPHHIGKLTHGEIVTYWRPIPE